MMEMGNETVNTLNNLLTGEISAADTYRQALEKLSDRSLQPQLEQVRAAHLERVKRLQIEIERLGGQPHQGGGVWGSFTSVLEGVAAMIGIKQAVSLLEEGEDKGLNDYRKALDKLEPRTKSLVANDLFPGQEETHRVMSNLKHSLQ
jgi:uncharacterized protein (TIGR02284 family)